MTRNGLVRIAAVAGLVAATAMVAYMIGRSRAVPPSAVAPAAAAPAMPDRLVLPAQARADAGLQVEPARELSRVDTLEATAVIALDETRTARIGSIVDGTVVRTLVEVGDRVRAGTLLAELHSHVVHDTWAEYRRAIAERRRLETELSYARDAEARAGRLLAEKAVSEQEQERAAANRIAAEQQLDMARTEVRRSEEALEHLGITNKEDPTGESGEEIPARSPLGGVVLERLVTTGTAVTAGTPLFVVSDLSVLWVMAEVDEQRLGALAVGRAVAVRVAAYPDERFPATITFVGDTVNPKTRRVVVRCTLPNAAGRLKPGMFATVVVDTGVPHRIIAVPAAALQELDGARIVFVEQADGAFLVRRVTVGAEQDGWVEITGGVGAGDRIVTAGSFLLKGELLKSAAPDEG